MKKGIPGLLLLPIVVLAACTLIGEDGRTVSEVDRQRQQWERLGFDAYDYDLTVLCYCPHIEPVHVQVRADTVSTATVLETGDPVEDFFRVRTIEDLFTTIEEATAQRAHRVDVRYDSAYGHPSRIYIDRDAQAVDEEVTYIAENVHPLRMP